MQSIIFKETVFYNYTQKTKNTPSVWHKSAIFHLISVKINKPRAAVAFVMLMTLWRIACVKGLALHIYTQRTLQSFTVFVLFASTSQFFIPLLVNKAYTESYINIHNKHTHLCGCLASYNIFNRVFPSLRMSVYKGL